MSLDVTEWTCNFCVYDVVCAEWPYGPVNCDCKIMHSSAP